MEFYPSVKKNETIKYAGIVLKLENTWLSKVIWAQKDKCHMLCFIGRSSLDLDLGVTQGTCMSQGARNGQLHGFRKILREGEQWNTGDIKEKGQQWEVLCKDRGGIAEGRVVGGTTNTQEI